MTDAPEPQLPSKVKGATKMDGNASTQSKVFFLIKSWPWKVSAFFHGLYQSYSDIALEPAVHRKGTLRRSCSPFRRWTTALTRISSTVSLQTSKHDSASMFLLRWTSTNSWLMIHNFVDFWRKFTKLFCGQSPQCQAQLDPNVGHTHRSQTVRDLAKVDWVHTCVATFPL